MWIDFWLLLLDLWLRKHRLIAFAFLFPLYPIYTIRRQHEAELKLLEEETAKRLEEAIRKNVEEKLKSEDTKNEIERRVEEGRKKQFDDVAAQLEKEKEAALNEARQKEVSILNLATAADLFIIFSMAICVFVWIKVEKEMFGCLLLYGV